MYGLGNLGMRPGNAKMMRPHNPLMSAGMTMMGPHLADGGQPDDAQRERLHGGTMSRISPQFTIGAVLRNLGLLGPKAAPPPAAAAPPLGSGRITDAEMQALTAPPGAGRVTNAELQDVINRTAPLAAPQIPSGGRITNQEFQNVAGYAEGGEVGASGSISPLMQQMLAGYQRSQANPPARPFAPAQAAPAATPPATGALGAAARPPAAPFSLPNAAAAQPASMVPRSPIQPGLMQGRPMTPDGQPIVPYMSPGISAPGFAHGGSPHHVQGPGGGQEDLIDAKLSDGEWVGDATFVSDVGDGSNKEGARRLDKLRDLVAQTKGRKGRYAPETPPLETLAKKAGIFGSKKKAVKKANGGPLSNVRTDRAYIPPGAATDSRDVGITGVRG